MKEENRKLLCLALNFLVTEGLVSGRKALTIFDEPEKLFQPGESWLGALNLSQRAKESILSGQLRSRALRELEKAEKKEYTLLTIGDPGYPEALRQTLEPPLVLYVKGQPDVLSWAAVAVVGSRRPSGYGRLMAEKLAEELAAAGLVVVSGLARGIDTCAHRGALRSGRTLAVLGSGLEVIYPRENKMLAEKIAEKGAVVSEFPLDSGPARFHFPLRNRIISGLSLGCLVVEASRRSGALITARLALDEGREVMALPGPVTSDLSGGTNFLIKNGAKLVETAFDVITELPSPWKEAAFGLLQARTQQKIELQGQEKAVYEALPDNSVIHIDELSDRIQMPVAELLTVLLALEMKELVVQEAGRMFRRR
ncbi:MAG: DNA-processing protein DprA [Candidatus Saccharicenans sp.]